MDVMYNLIQIGLKNYCAMEIYIGQHVEVCFAKKEDGGKLIKFS